eukprot:CAMPEP_0197635538 /NCGR_PEP_ID=MMETSP1338-20131121/11331_1 /TAXON_ID=43686 ORGANISM="Pelagodinium beii, Strain RCC1491" /NCGR_SAMPLE_ID=MMETSP1338 /ASSEMBLY_ACC=CAM_ASM_000754 /LENGTH=226 /DNA_ID=CAMNT_0043207613 /DNA_START=29 /DNA_END=706 /DNA_ORIENTATION=-
MALGLSLRASQAHRVAGLLGRIRPLEVGPGQACIQRTIVFREAASAVKLRRIDKAQEVDIKEKGRPLGEFKVGQAVHGTVVQIYCPGGVSVDVGCAETFAFLEVEEFQDGFDPFQFKPGQEIVARVLELNPDAVVEDHGEPDPRGDFGNSGKLHLTMRTGDVSRPPRYVANTSKPPNLMPFNRSPKEEWLNGEVVMMSSWAVYVKILAPSGEPFVGILLQEDIHGK